MWLQVIKNDGSSATLILFCWGLVDGEGGDMCSTKRWPTGSDGRP
jgi:hypothetical protein